MAKRDEEMRTNLQFVRVFVDREAIARINRIARDEGRSQQRQVGLLLERIAKLHEHSPEKLAELGLISPFHVPHPKAA